MSGFRTAKGEQSSLKIAFYGPPGSGKTMTALLIAEGLAKLSGKRIAYVDTENGTTFYCQKVPTRAVHPEAFDFDALYTRSIMETLSAIKSLDTEKYGIIVIDSISHIWQSCIEAYSGRQTSIGTIPMQAWGKIKRPYKELITFLLNSPLHLILCGRQGTEYATDEETEELKAVGVKMRAEGETPYEPSILLRMEALKPKRTNEVATIIAYAEKDRTGVLSGRSFTNPTFESLCKPLLPLLGASQTQIESLSQTAMKDAEAIADDERDRIARSSEFLKEWTSKVNLAKSVEQLKQIGKLITPELKAQMLPADVASLREAYQARERELPAAKAA